MRFSSSREQKIELPRWVDDGGLGWTPDAPLQAEPRQAPREDLRAESPAEPQTDPRRQQRPRRRMRWRRRRRSFHISHLAERAGLPGAAVSAPTVPMMGTVEPNAGAALSDALGPEVEPTAKPPAETPEQPAEPGELPTHAQALRAPIGFSTPANSNRAPAWLVARLGIGLAQGVALLLLLVAHDRGVWPGSDPYLLVALLLAGLLAPLALLEGLGEVQTTLLLLWSGTLGFVIATLGLWQQWRGGLELMPAAAIALFALIAHIAIRAALRQPGAGQDSWGDVTWTVMARLVIWAGVTALAFVILASANGFFSWLKPANFPLLGLASASGFALTADGWLQRHVRSALPVFAMIALPFLAAAALVLLGLYLLHARISGGHLLVLAAFLVVAIHACDRDILKNRWRRMAEGFGGLVVLALVAAAGFGLYARIHTDGWTDMRIYAAIAAGLLALCGLVTLSAALLPGRQATGGKVRMGPVLALLAAALCLLLSTPLLDPLALAVKSQLGRLERGADPAKFDFAWLKQGGRFGREALAHLARQPNAQIARGASLAMVPAPAAPAAAIPVALKPQPLPPAPPKPGSNIALHGAAQLPAAFLTQDWSGQQAPACLSRTDAACDAWLLDLDGDGQPEILLAQGDDNQFSAHVLKLEHGRWILAAALSVPHCHGLLSAMRSRGLSVTNPLPRWRDVMVAGMRLTPAPATPIPQACPGF